MKLYDGFKSYWFWFLIMLLTALPAFLVNLGALPFIDDEAIRSTVAFEMLKSGDYLTPRTAGELYLKKPPLFNWLVAASFRLTGQSGELPGRLVMVFSLLAFIVSIFLLLRKYTGDKIALATAFMFLTTGRILIYESLYGLIDITLSWIVFSVFIGLYRLFEKERWLALFLFGYGLTAVAFLLKGLPALVFLATTLLVLFIDRKRFAVLFSWQHIAGIILFLIITGSYYLAWSLENNLSPEAVWNVLFTETTRRTAAHYGIGKTLLHLFTFPFEMIYHFLPWSLLFPVLAFSKVRREVLSHPFYRYLLLCFFFNILVYWSSPEVYPRYILMLIPLILAVGFYGLNIMMEQKSSLRTIWNGLLLFLTGAGLVASAALPFIPFHTSIPLMLIATAGVLLFGGMLILSIYQPGHRIYYAIISLLLARIIFDLTVIPERVATSEKAQFREELKEFVESVKDEPVYFWWNDYYDPDGYYGRRIPTYWFIGYVGMFRDSVVPTTDRKDLPGIGITREYMLAGYDVDILWKVLPPEHDSPIIFFRFKPVPEGNE
ncbi:MAG: hypothetical protein Kow00127_08640 [Bacteroidales bacterium]